MSCEIAYAAFQPNTKGISLIWIEIFIDSYYRIIRLLKVTKYTLLMHMIYSFCYIIWECQNVYLP